MTTNLPRIRLGVSSCLLGEKVRYDGGHKLDRFVRDTLGRYVDFVPVCPEVEAGFPTPREAMRLVERSKGVRLVTAKTDQDVTDQMTGWARARVAALEEEDLCGFIFKSKSPSSGMERVKLYDRNGVPARRGVGVFAGIFMEHFPLLPVEEDGRLHDPVLRENFVERIFVMQRWRDEVAPRPTRGRLVAFHTKHKLLIMAHSQERHRELGRIVARAKELSPKALVARYLEVLMPTLLLKATARKNANVLRHAMGYFKRVLSADEKQELSETIEHYRTGLVPLIVPVTLINHYVRKYDQPYLRDQVYLNPHPLELKLRNHV